MQSVPVLIALIAAGYVVGSIPFGLLIAKSKGIDIRQHGSKNIGATNVGRVLGKKFFFVCFFLDMLKGLIPTLTFGLVNNLVRTDAALTPTETWWWLGAMIAPVLGHMFSVFLRFKGGKGVATGLGTLLAVFPVLTIAGAIALAVFLTVLKLTKYVGVSSCAAALSLPITTLALVFVVADRFGGAWPAAVATGLLAAVVIYKHRGNLKRTLAGTEHKIGQRVSTSTNAR
ncbi:MAG: glycerol-3-phosphate 1-O-acyltransferase PlsY [Phycisphaerales bacterium]|nr:glycerol-3-phosphate 1-O-acyltransferase PlsY [Phycisphaerales bacterium]MCB9835981.1 glycerol-3-phosphate 1-O-acyltransferase PlsY [Phycisphaera sp.]